MAKMGMLGRVKETNQRARAIMRQKTRTLIRTLSILNLTHPTHLMYLTGPMNWTGKKTLDLLKPSASINMALPWKR